MHFISHSGKDDVIVNLVKNALMDFGDTWVDHERIGDKLFSAINDAISTSTHFFLVWSKNSAESNWVKDEYNAGYKLWHDKKIKMVILMVDETPIPPLLSDCVYYKLDKDSVKKIVNDAMQKTGIFPSQVKVFRKKVRKDYENFPSDPVIKDFKKFNGYKYYVAQPYKTRISSEDNVAKFVLEKIRDGSQHLIPIAGNYGCGKSAICHYALYSVCGIESDKVPIFVPMGQLKKTKETFDINEFVTLVHEYIVNIYSFNISLEEFKIVISEGKVLFFLDALDEFSNTISESVIKQNLETIITLSEKNFVILTCREAYLSGQIEADLIEHHDLIRIKDFEKVQIKKFLHQKFDKDETAIAKITDELLNNTSKLSEYAKKPLFLNVICDNFERIKDYAVINEAILLRILTEEWIKHDVLKQGFDEEEKNAKIEHRQRISEILAITEGLQRKPIGISDIQKEVSEQLRPYGEAYQDKLDQYFKDAVTSTFLIKEQWGQYRCMLKSIREYLTACGIMHNIRHNRRISLFKHLDAVTSIETFHFLKDLIDIEWTIKPYVEREINNITERLEEGSSKLIQKLLEMNRDHTESVLEIISKSRNSTPKNNVWKLVQMLSLAGRLPHYYNLSNLNLEGARVATLNGAALEKSDLREAELERADLKGINLASAILEKANLREANLEKANLSNAHLERANLREADLVKTDLPKASLFRADLIKANLVRANLEKAIMNEANLEVAYLEECNLREASLSKANLSGAVLIKANLRDADLSGANMRASSLVRADLEGADLRKSDLRSADLTSADLTGANLEGADLSDAILRGTRLSRTKNLPISQTEALQRGAIF